MRSAIQQAVEQTPPHRFEVGQCDIHLPADVPDRVRGRSQQGGSVAGVDQVADERTELVLKVLARRRRCRHDRDPKRASAEMQCRRINRNLAQCVVAVHPRPNQAALGASYALHMVEPGQQAIGIEAVTHIAEQYRSTSMYPRWR